MAVARRPPPGSRPGCRPMKRLNPAELPQFLRRYRLPGGRVRAVRVRHAGARAVAVEFRLAVRPALRELDDDPKPVALRLRLDGVEEFRFQMRPNQPKAKIADARLGY